MIDKKFLVFAVLSFSAGLLSFHMFERRLANFLGPSVWVEAHCDSENDACLYARFEESGGRDASTFVYIFASERAARRGLLSYQNLGCEAAYRLSVSWTDATNALISGPEGCVVSGYMGGADLTVKETDSSNFVVSIHKIK